MLNEMEVHEIIIDHYRKGKSQRQISKELNIHRKTVSKYILLHQQSIKCGKLKPQKYDSSRRKKVKLTSTVIAEIDKCLALNKQRVSQGAIKQQMKNIDIYEHLQQLNFDIGYTTVCNYLRAKKDKLREKFIKQHYQPAQVVEFDWGTVKLTIGGQFKKLKMAVFTLAFSNHRFAMLFENEQMNSFLEAHVYYLNAIEGVPDCFVYDNMKTAVAKFTYRSRGKQPTEDLLKISTYYAFNYRFTTAAKGNEKGHVERSVEYVRRKCFATRIQFDDLDQANQYLADKVKGLNNKTGQHQSKSIQDLFEVEQQHFKKLPLSTYQTAITKQYSVNKYQTICCAANHYSIPENCHDKKVEVKLFSDKLMIYNAKDQLIATHIRSYKKNQWVININHYLFTLKTKPGALACSYALKQAPALLKHIYNKYYKNDDRNFIETAIACNENNFDIKQWLKAITTYKSKTNNQISSDIILASIQQECTRKKRNNSKVIENKSRLNQNITNASQQQLRQIQKLF